MIVMIEFTLCRIVLKLILIQLLDENLLQ